MQDRRVAIARAVVSKSVHANRRKRTEVNAMVMVSERDQSREVSEAGNEASDSADVQGEPSAASRRSDVREATKDANAAIVSSRQRLTSS